MTDENVNNVSTGNTSYSEELSAYLYPKISYLPNDDGFTATDVENYGLTINNNQIDISSTHKLIKYLKAFVRKTLSNISDKIDEIDDKLDSDDVDRSLSSTSWNPIANRVVNSAISSINTTLSGKANIEHTHTMSQIDSLDTTLNSIRGIISNHADDTDNPHHVTLSQLGLTDSGNVDYPTIDSSLPINANITCRKYGKMVQFKFDGEIRKNVSASETFMTLKSEFRPANYTTGIAYLRTSKKCVAYALYTDGRFGFATKIDSGEKIVINDCYFTA